jgi:hypothetical protein
LSAVSLATVWKGTITANRNRSFIVTLPRGCRSWAWPLSERTRITANKCLS